jgi:hypothetical protein
MTKQEIIDLATKDGFWKLDKDNWEDSNENIHSTLRYLRFVCSNQELDEPELRWIWYKNDLIFIALNNSLVLKERLDRKQQIIKNNTY